ncbi:hypothetical protein [Paenibacillus sp. DMB5]|uniref:hypothetical protein n=1 Tax=Paenibacillus sp. DMB5 TaxID=1780103 RepID=UPI00076C1507|nr:hypothetical protein [Paenibacillus sp. DMB5]KUP25789.1 hypothetical protein AWJ19_19385 [Paenibacillus sp. DMB5]
MKEALVNKYAKQLKENVGTKEQTEILQEINDAEIEMDDKIWIFDSLYNELSKPVIRRGFLFLQESQDNKHLLSLIANMSTALKNKNESEKK